MPSVHIVPRAMRERKPPHGAPCNRCGLCCYAKLCDIAQAIHKRSDGPCPELMWDDKGSRCGLIDRSDGEKRDAAKLLINTGSGCDMVLHGEKRDSIYDFLMSLLDAENRHRLYRARKLWGLI